MARVPFRGWALQLSRWLKMQELRIGGKWRESPVGPWQILLLPFTAMMLISEIGLYSESNPHTKADFQITLPNKTWWRDDSLGGSSLSENRSNRSRSLLPLERIMQATRNTHVRHSPAMRAYKVTAKITAVSVDHRCTTSFESPR